ncbi:MAG TPA: bifunctional ADP-heptose synthase [Thermoanaerobaculia bacterium]|nr:bifunctional ADP-heptose synthase [Thermoanaerobaculia bacterium]
MPRKRLLSVIDGFAGRRLVVAGDYVLDRFLYGHPKRVSREAPVLILRFWKEEHLPGGAGNTAANVRSLGGVPIPVGAVGKDDAGARLREALAGRGIDTDGLLAAPDYGTPTKTRILAGAPHGIKQQVVRYDRESNLPEDSALAARIADALERSAAGADAAVLSDYGYGAVPKDANAILRGSLPSGAPILVDSRHGLTGFAGADALTPNEEELEEWIGKPLGDSAEELESAARSLQKAVAARIVLVTRGSRGMALFQDGASPVSIPVHGTDQVADVTGAGDTVLATFSLALASGASPLEAALLANFAGGVVVMKMGTATITPEELRDAVGSDRTILE